MSVLVSINCITYNHEDYIADAIEGFLLQKTEFDYEILIGEDCSTDNTRRIVEQYIAKYPDKIRLVISEENIGAGENAKRIFELVRENTLRNAKVMIIGLIRINCRNKWII
ncbi:glycosyl transferase [Sporosarcina newyorkensis 2681]|uniref:Glycosyl transferase n=1 Tax=Sporosarcina newyorkensis 2681 TaxID=1027292 RepID=F9DNM9_9BACL|nr:glycosyltransferase [Sporosarcina newyorkensis]EGQ27591.1 glycosyl transferase [Sporosarcina newyorkensis 2681]